VILYARPIHRFINYNIILGLSRYPRFIQVLIIYDLILHNLFLLQMMPSCGMSTIFTQTNFWSVCVIWYDTAMFLNGAIFGFTREMVNFKRIYMYIYIWWLVPRHSNLDLDGHELCRSPFLARNELIPTIRRVC
jgi:hypothetical protein